MKNRQRGVTLMELLTVVTVIGILTSISVPTYRQYTLRAQRTEAKAALMARAGALERCFTRFNAYDDDDCEVAGSFPEDLAERHYTITAPTLTAGTFTAERGAHGRAGSRHGLQDADARQPQPARRDRRRH